MSLLSEFGRRAPPQGRVRTVVVGRPVDVVPSPRPSSPHFLGGTADDLASDRVATARRVGQTLLASRADDASLARLGQDVDENVDVWTPAIRLRSCDALVSALAEVDDAVCGIDVAFTDALVGTDAVSFEWTAIGHFSGPAFLDDDEFVEPNGAVVRLAGSLRMTFGIGQRVGRIRCYYDRLAMLEQMLHGTDGGCDLIDR